MRHGYEVTVTWTGNRGEGTRHYRGYGRDHTVESPEKPQLLGSADRTFHGDRDRWNPELFLLAALSECHMLSYLHVCVQVGVVMTDYVDHATGTMVSDDDGSGRFAEVLLSPRVTVTDSSMIPAAERAHARANELCFIANSVNFPVRHRPETLVAAT